MDFEEELLQKQKEVNGKRLEKLLFHYSQKVDVSIHYSLLSTNIMRVWRIIALLALSFRMFFSLKD